MNKFPVMKKLFLFAALAAVSAMAGCDGGMREQKFMGMSGNPESVKTTMFEAIEKFGEVTEQGIGGVYVHEFDKDGHVVKMTAYDSEGEVVYSNTNEYVDGKCVESTSFQMYNNVTTTNTLKSSTGNSFSWEQTSSDGKTTTSLVERGKDKTTTTVKDSNGNIVSKYEQFYDGRGNIIELKAYGEDGSVVYSEKSTFDDDAREVTKTMTSRDEETVFSYSYEAVDDKGNWIRRIERLDGELIVTTREIKY
jgi:hypothetical protein